MSTVCSKSVSSETLEGGFSVSQDLFGFMDRYVDTYDYEPMMLCSTATWPEVMKPEYYAIRYKDAIGLANAVQNWNADTGVAVPQYESPTEFMDDMMIQIHELYDIDNNDINFDPQRIYGAPGLGKRRRMMRQNKYHEEEKDDNMERDVVDQYNAMIQDGKRKDRSHQRGRKRMKSLVRKLTSLPRMRSRSRRSRKTAEKAKPLEIITTYQSQGTTQIFMEV